MKFPIIIEDKKKRRLKLFVVFSIIIIIPEGLLFYPEDENNLQLTIMFTIPAIIWIIALFWLNFIKSFKIIGEIIYKNDGIYINSTLLNLDDIKIIKITYQNYYGVWIKVNMTQGNNNEIFILTTDNKQYRLKIYLEDKRSFELLKRFATSLIENNVKVQFYMGHKKIYPKKKT